MILREAAATSGVPRNKILVFSSFESLEEEEYRRENRLARWERGRTAIDDVGANFGRLYLADDPIRTLIRRVPACNPWHGRISAHAAIVEIIVTAIVTKWMVVAELFMEQ